MLHAKKQTNDYVFSDVHIEASKQQQTQGISYRAI